MVRVSGVPVTSPLPLTEIPLGTPPVFAGVFSTVTDGVHAETASAMAAIPNTHGVDLAVQDGWDVRCVVPGIMVFAFMVPP
jgi:hypothetical protein